MSLKFTEVTPKELAIELFSNPPQSTNKYGFLAEVEDIACIFEILMIVYLEGLKIFTNDFEFVKENNEFLQTYIVTQEHLECPTPWFNSIGFHLDISVDDSNIFTEQYCRVILNDFLHQGLFAFKGIPDNYDLIINGNCLEENKTKGLDELYATFANGNTKYVISFAKMNL